MCCVIGNYCLTTYFGKMSYLFCMLEQARFVVICVILLLWLSPVFISVLQLMAIAYKSSVWFLSSTMLMANLVLIMFCCLQVWYQLPATNCGARW